MLKGSGEGSRTRPFPRSGCLKNSDVGGLCGRLITFPKSLDRRTALQRKNHRLRPFLFALHGQLSSESVVAYAVDAACVAVRPNYNRGAPSRCATLKGLSTPEQDAGAVGRQVMGASIRVRVAVGDLVMGGDVWLLRWQWPCGYWVHISPRLGQLQLIGVSGWHMRDQVPDPVRDTPFEFDVAD